MADITEVDSGYSRGPDVSNWMLVPKQLVQALLSLTAV